MKKNKFIFCFILLTSMFFVSQKVSAATTEDEFKNLLLGSYDLVQSDLYSEKDGSTINLTITEEDVASILSIGTIHNDYSITDYLSKYTVQNIVIKTTNIEHTSSDGKKFINYVIFPITSSSCITRSGYFVSGGSSYTRFYTTIRIYEDGTREYIWSSTMSHDFYTFDDYLTLSNMTSCSYIFTTCPIIMYPSDASSEYTQYQTTTYSAMEKNPSLSLNITPEYNEDYTECTLTAEMIGVQDGYSIYYSDSMITNIDESSSSGITHSGGGLLFGDDLWNLYTNPLTYKSNKTVYFKVVDSNNTSLLTEIYTINQISSELTDVDFSVTFDNSQNGMSIFTPKLTSSLTSYYDIVFSYEIVSGESADFGSYNGSSFLTNEEKYPNKYILSSNGSYYMKFKSTMDIVDGIIQGAVLNSTTSLKLNFEIYNKNTNILVDSKSYNLTLKFNQQSLTGTTDISNNQLDDFESLNENSSIRDVINAASSTFESFKYMFNILPGFVWAMLTIALVVVIVLRILGR